MLLQHRELPFTHNCVNRVALFQFSQDYIDSFDDYVFVGTTMYTDQPY